MFRHRERLFFYCQKSGLQTMTNTFNTKHLSFLTRRTLVRMDATSCSSTSRPRTFRQSPRAPGATPHRILGRRVNIMLTRRDRSRNKNLSLNGYVSNTPHSLTFSLHTPGATPRRMVPLSKRLRERASLICFSINALKMQARDDNSIKKLSPNASIALQSHLARQRLDHRIHHGLLG